MIFNIGPFQLYRVPESETISITFTAIEHWPCGWEYGWDDPITVDRRPWIHIRMGKLILLSFEPLKNGFEVWLMGFWWIK